MLISPPDLALHENEEKSRVVIKSNSTTVPKKFRKVEVLTVNIKGEGGQMGSNQEGKLSILCKENFKSVKK